MKRFIYFLVFFSSLSHLANSLEDLSIQQFYKESQDEPEALIFIPPEGWLAADPKLLTPHVKACVVGKGQKSYPPSINLGIEPFKGSVKDYLKIINSINVAQGASWKDLGLIKTQAGNASLSQVDMPSEWGDVKLMHVILIRNETLYILTAAALKEEFPLYYKEFFNSMTSLKFNKDVYEMVSSAKKRSDLYKAVKDLKKEFDLLAEREKEIDRSALFHSESYQTQNYASFKRWLEENYSDMSLSWRNFLLRKIERELLQS